MAWVSLIHQYDQPLTDAQLRAADVKVTLDGEAVALDSPTITSLLGRSWTLDELTDGVAAFQGGAWTVEVSNFPGEYPLPAAQVTSLKTVTVDNPIAGYATEAKQLPDNHQVEVSNQPTDFPDAAAFGARDPLARYKIADIEKGAVSYYGFLALDGAWIILKQDKVAGAFRYKNGGSGYAQAWADRATPTYSYLDTLTGV